MERWKYGIMSRCGALHWHDCGGGWARPNDMRQDADGLMMLYRTAKEEENGDNDWRKRRNTKEMYASARKL